jgi:hypothetical protein
MLWERGRGLTVGVVEGNDVEGECVEDALDLRVARLVAVDDLPGKVLDDLDTC